MIVTVTKDGDRIASGEVSTLALSDRRLPEVGDRLEFWESPRKPDRKLLGVSLCQASARLAGGGVSIAWDPEYLTRRKLLPQVKRQGDFTLDVVTPAAAPSIDDLKIREAFASAWCQFCKRAGRCAIQKSKEQQAAHLVAHEGSIACTVFTPRRVQSWEIDRKNFLKLEAAGQLNLLKGVNRG